MGSASGSRTKAVTGPRKRHHGSPRHARQHVGAPRHSTVMAVRHHGSPRHARRRVARRGTVMAVCLVSVMIAAAGFTASAGAAGPRHQHLRPAHRDTSGQVQRQGSKHGHKRSKRRAVGAVVRTSDRVVGTANFQVGDDYTQNSHLSSGTGGNTSAVASAKSLLTSMDSFQNVALMGWGADDPEPSPGRYQWASLDNEVDVMGATVPASQRMITLCTAPGWMKVGGESQEWNMEAAVSPSYFQDFANLAALVAERYDGTHKGANGQLLPKVDYFDVWNEMKGFLNASANTWDYQGYTTMYNDVYRAIKAVRPDARIGGPYAPVGAGTAATTSDPSSVQGAFGVVDYRDLDVLTYWLQHKVGAQFVSMDGGPAVTDESGFASGQYFVAVVNWLRGLNDTLYPGATTLPIVWSEFYSGLDSTTGLALGQEAVAIDVSNIIQAGSAGVNYMLIWEMGGSPGGLGLFDGESVWSDTADAGGGRPTALYSALRDLHDSFGPGTPIYQVSTSGPISALANRNSVLLVSHSPGGMTVEVNKTRVHMAPYAVTVEGVAKRSARR